MRSTLSRGLAGAAALATALTVVATASPANAAAESLHYVALGDSYSAGSGVWPPDPQASPLCLRTTKNYPHVLAAATGANLTDVTCGAAETKHFYTSQYPGVAAQLDVVTADADLVTLTIGGNDNGVFIGAIVACGTAGAATLGYGSPCKNIYGSYFDNQVDATTYPAVKKALRDIHAKAPTARVAILGYPSILPATKGCFTKMPIAQGDVPYLNNLQGHLNSVVKRAASETGTTFVDLAAALVGRDACAPIGTRWIEPVLFGTNTVPVHPNALGEAAMADRTLAVLGL
ncbi:MAG: SGNH/GDSL hydrolase family protein [Pedococcus sp.]